MMLPFGYFYNLTLNGRKSLKPSQHRLAGGGMPCLASCPIRPIPTAETTGLPPAPQPTSAPRPKRAPISSSILGHNAHLQARFQGNK